MTDWMDIEAWTERLSTDERERDRHLTAYDQMIRAYHGHAYEGSDDALTPENFYFSYVSSTVPGLVAYNPRVRTRSRRSGAEDVLSVPMRHGLNRWIKDENLEEILKEIATGFCFTWDVAMVTNEPDMHQGSVEDRALFRGGKLRDKRGKYRPRMYAIHPRLFAVDSRAVSLDRTEYQFHRWFASAADMEEEASDPESGWNLDEVADLVSSAGSTKDAASAVDPSRGNRVDSVEADQLEFVSIWVPGLETDDKGPDDGYNGTILTLGRTNTGMESNKWRMPRPPVAYFGSETGPYQVFGAYKVKGKLWPMGPLCANHGNIESLNATARGIDTANAEGKNALLYDLSKGEAAEAINNSESGVLVGIPNLEQTTIIPATFGFASTPQYTAHAMHKDVLQRNSGMNDAMQGNVTGVGTATENQISNETTMRRNGALYNTFSEAVVRCLEKVAHYFFWDDDIEFQLGEEFFEAESDLELPPGSKAVFQGGQQKKNRSLSLRDYELEIEPYSMGRTDQVQLSVSLGVWTNYLLQTAQMRQVFPWIDWQAMDELYAMQLNMPEFARIVDNAAAMEAAPWEEGGETPQVRFPQDRLPASAPRMNRPPSAQPQPMAGAPSPPQGMQPPPQGAV
jgi:hypothetical protein